jgi:hypothetical protein
MYPCTKTKCPRELSFITRRAEDFFNAINITNFTGLNIGLASAAFGTLPTAYHRATFGCN